VNRDLVRVLAVWVVSASVCAAQQLPAGTRAADDHSREGAAAERLREAEAALEKQDYAGAEAKLKVLAAERPKDARVLYDLGFAEERTHDDDAAAQAYAGAIAADATLAEPRVALGLLDARAGRAAKAHEELAQAAQMGSAAPELRGRALRALAALDEGTHPDTAVEELLAAVKLTGETPADATLSAELAAKKGDTEDAEAAYRRVLQHEPGNVDGTAGLARVLVQEKKNVEAEALLYEALKAHPDDPRLVSQLAALFATEDKGAEAIPLVEKLRAQPGFATDANLMRMEARLYAGNGQNAEAEKLYAALLAKQPGDASLLDDLGGVLVKEGKYAEAQGVLAKAVGMRASFATPEDWAEAAGHLAFAAEKNHDPRGTLQALAARATVLPNTASSLFLEALAHDTLHETKDAVKAYRAFLAVAGGKFPDEEFQARHRLVALENMR